jgi:glycerate kinase
MNRRVVIAPDSFKGAISARQAAEAIAGGVRRAAPSARIDCAPMADGGEGTLDVLVDAESGVRRRVAAHGPLAEPVDVVVGLIRHVTTAVVELAGVSGYGLIDAPSRDPMKTSTYGLGEVLRAAVETEVEQIILGVGGSATVDGGAGMMQALGLALLDGAGRVLPPHAAGGDLGRIARVAWDDPPPNLHDVPISIAVDVLNPLCGPNGAAAVFGPQKGASAEAVAALERGLAHWADILEALCGRRLRDEPGAGAAGGVALPLVALAEATMTPGVDLVADAVGLANRVATADLVITGEGRLDRQSMMGKVVGAVGRMCRTVGVPCVAIVGAAGEGADDCLGVLDRYVTLGGTIGETRERLERTAAEVIGEWW